MTIDANTPREPGGRLGRRGILAAASALFAAALARLTGTGDTALATDGSPLIVGQSNSSSSSTGLATSSASSGLLISNAGSGAAVQGNNGGSGIGVLGQSGSGYGMEGTASGSGVGLVGFSPNGVGLQGTSTSSGGVSGSSQTYYGCYGVSNSGVGIGGLSSSGIGGFFQTSTGSQYAAWVQNTQTGSNTGEALGLLVQGNLVVEGTKSAAVRTSDGIRLLYAVESPISLFEDVGTAQVIDGAAHVSLDPIFAETIDTSSYHVFLTSEGDDHGLYVTGKTPQGFEIQEKQGGVSNVAVSYRIIGKRNLPGADKRLPRIQLPTVPPSMDKRYVSPPQVP